MGLGIGCCCCLDKFRDMTLLLALCFLICPESNAKLKSSSRLALWICELLLPLMTHELWEMH